MVKQGNEMSEFDKNDPLWDVLGRVKRPEASPWFVDRVLNNLPGLEVSSNKCWTWPWFSKWVPVGVMGLVFAWAALSIQSPATESESTLPLQSAVDFEIIQDLDFYIAQADSTAWMQK